MSDYSQKQDCLFAHQNQRGFAFVRFIICKQKQMQSQQKNNMHIRAEYTKASPISYVYDEIMRNFNRQALRLRLKLSNPTFADDQMIQPRKTLPKIEIQPEKSAKRKYYSNKLVAYDGILVHDKREVDMYNLKEEPSPQTQFRKLFIPKPKQVCVLSDRNKRIMELYRRAEKDSQFLPSKTKHSINTINPNKELANPPKNEQMLTNTQIFRSVFAIDEKRMIDILKQATQKKKHSELSHMKPERSKSNIIINSYSIQSDSLDNSSATIEGKKIQQSVDHKAQKVKTLKRIKYEPKPISNVHLTKKPNWKNVPLPLNRIEKQEFFRLIRYYLHIGEPTPISSGFYKAYIGPGNNCPLIKKLLKDRGYWTIVETLQQFPNFVWTQKKSKKFNLTLTNSPKKQFIPIPRKVPQENKNELKKFIHLKENSFMTGCSKLMEEKHFFILMNQIKQRFIIGNSVKLFSRISQAFIEVVQDYKLKGEVQEVRSAQVKLHNHMDNSSVIGDKKGLHYMMSKYCQIFEENIDQLLPKTVHLANSENYPSIFQLVPEGPWILKPGQATNRGQGITIHTDKQGLVSEILKKKKHKGGVKYTNIIQKYIDPLLYNGRKFDIRIWVLWTGRKMWWYKQGYLRTSSKQFTYKNMNKFIHLTNDAIQSQSQQFGKFQPANKLSFNQFEKYLQAQYNYNGFYSEMIQKMKNIAIKAFRIGNCLFDQENKLYNFELFGLDFLIDNRFQPWLIQCNTNPCLQINCSLLSRLVPNMLENVMNLTVDAYFPVPLKRKKADESAWNPDSFKFQLLYNGEFDQQIQEKIKEKGINLQYLQQDDAQKLDDEYE